MRILFAVVVAIVIGTSCLLDEEDGDGTNYVAPSEIAEAYKDAVCTHLALCGLFPDKASCLAAELQSTSGVSTVFLDPNVEAAIYAGHVIYNGSNVKTCIDAYAARTCDRTGESYRTTPEECRLIVRGTLGSGEPCYIDEECISQRCTGDTFGGCSIGQCVGDTAPNVSRAKIGDPCGSFGGCVDGAYCDQLTGVCAALKTSGITCTLDSECDYGLGCRGTTGARTCSPLPAVGQPCATEGVCRDVGTFCDFTADMCKQVGLANAQCTSTTQCSTYYPCNFTTSPGMCKQGPTIGGMCSSSNRCFDEGTYCNFSTSMCEAKRAAGMPCNNSEECESDFCDLNTSQCTQPLTCF